MATLTTKRSHKVSSLSKKRKQPRSIGSPVWSLAIVALLVAGASAGIYLGSRDTKQDRPMSSELTDIRPMQLMTQRDPEHSGRYIVSQIGSNGPRVIGSFTKEQLADLDVGIDLHPFAPK